MKQTIASAALAFVATGACAQYYSGQDLVQGMITPSKQVSAIEYIKGNMDAYAAVGSFCPPSHITGQMAFDQMLKFLAPMKTSELREYTATSYIEFNFRRIWPCRKRGAEL